MQKSITLYPVVITEGAIFENILSSAGTGEDYRSIAGNHTIYVGTIGFDTGSLNKLSSACVINGFKADYQQKLRTASLADVKWTLVPRKLTDFTATGNSLDLRGYNDFGQSVTTITRNDDYEAKTATFVDGDNIEDVDADGIFGGTAWLGVHLSGQNTSTFQYRQYMKNLKATVTYTARYYARFYDTDGNLVETQTVNGGESATAPTDQSLQREGYSLRWTVDGFDGNFANSFPESETTDLTFRAMYVKLPRILTVVPPEKGYIDVQRYENDVWGPLEASEIQTNGVFYTAYYNDKIRLVAHDCNTTTEDLTVTVNGDAHTVDGGSDTNLTILEINALTDVSTIVSVSASTVRYSVATTAGAGGSITGTHSVIRHGNTNITITPDIGYEIASVEVDGTAVTVTNKTGMTVSLTDITAARTVSATFSKVQIPITFQLPTGVTVDGPSQVSYGDTETWTFQCDNNHSLTGLTVDSTQLLSDVFKQITEYEHTLYYITEPVTIAATITDDLVTVAIQQTEGGTVIGDAGKFIRGAGSLQFGFVSDTGHRFVKWYNDETETTLTINITQSVTVSALFELASLTVATDITGNGRVIVITPGENYEKELSECWFNYGDTVRIQLVADDGWRFQSGKEEYDIDGETYNHVFFSQITVYTITIGENATVFVAFEHLSYNVILNTIPENNSTEILTEPNDGTAFFYGTEVTFRAVPAEGWYFFKWVDRIPGPTGFTEEENFNPERTIEITRQFSSTAHFLKHIYDIDTIANEGGVVSANKTVEHGDDFLIEITADYGQRIADVLLDGVSVYDNVTLTRRGGSYLLHSVTAPHTVEVRFAPKTYTNNRKLLDYYPPVIAAILDIQELMRVLQLSNDALWDAMSFVLENQYIDTATEEGVKMWERELGIVPASTDTLAQRKARLRLKWVPSNRFTMKWLYEWLQSACGTKDVLMPTVEDYTLHVTLPWSVSWKTIFDDLEQYKPANIALDRRVALPQSENRLLAGFAIETRFEIEFTEREDTP